MSNIAKTFKLIILTNPALFEIWESPDGEYRFVLGDVLHTNIAPRMFTRLGTESLFGVWDDWKSFPYDTTNAEGSKTTVHCWHCATKVLPAVWLKVFQRIRQIMGIYYIEKDKKIRISRKMDDNSEFRVIETRPVA